MFYKFIISGLLVLFVAACATKPKDAADASGSGAIRRSRRYNH